MMTLLDAVMDILSTSTGAEAHIIKMRYGIITGKCESLDHIAKTLGFHKESVRDTEMMFLRKLRKAYPGMLPEPRRLDPREKFLDDIGH